MKFYNEMRKSNDEKNNWSHVDWTAITLRFN